MARILVDTSAVYALVDRDDANHRAAAARLKTLQRQRAEPLLTNFVVPECYALILVRLGSEMARRWLFDNLWPIERITTEDERRARSILHDYQDKTFSYTDATTFASMERLRMRRAFSFDKHFRQFGLDLD